MKSETLDTKRVGRPAKPPAAKYVKLLVSLPPEQAAWLKRQPDGVSGTVQKALILIQESQACPDPSVPFGTGLKGGSQQ